MMENFEIPENPEYTEQIRKFKTTDKAHADLFNATFQLLFNNEAFLKKMLEKQGIDIQEKFQQNYEQLTGYTDTKIGELINGAPETLDTIKEIADAILENETIVEALNEAVGKKLNKDGDLTDTTVTFITEDEEDSNRWKNIGKLVTGKMKDILNHVSIMSNNLKYLKKMLGSTDITKLADGTVTGAISKLNTDLNGKSKIKVGTSETSFCDAAGGDGITSVFATLDKIHTGISSMESGFHNTTSAGPIFGILLQKSDSSGQGYSGIAFSYATMSIVYFAYIGGTFYIKVYG